MFLRIKIIFFILLSNLSAENLDKCKWDHKNKISCIEIVGKISNESKFSRSGINKIIINKKQIQEMGSVDLIDVLKTIPDINITQSGPKGQQASMFMRGTGSNHTLVMINGIAINDQSTAQGLHDFGVDFIQTIQQIEVYPGSGASHFGTNAIGGAINIILTGDYKDSFSITSDIKDNYELSGNKVFINDDSSLNIKVGSVKNKTISAKGNLSDEKDALKNYSTNINYEKFYKETLRFYNTVYIRQTISEYDSTILNQTGYEGDNKMGTIQFGLENQNDLKKNDYIFYYNIYDRKYDERSVVDKYKSEALGFKYDLTKIIKKKISYGIGSEYKYDWGYFNNNGSYQASTKGHTDNFALYGNIGWDVFQNSNISIFGRNDNHKQTGKNNTYKFSFEQSFDNFDIGISNMNGLRNPTLYEMFGTDNYGYSGNKNLKPEKSNTHEIYANITFNKNFNINLRAFRSNIQNNIEYLNNKYQNDEDNIDLNQSGLNSHINFTNENTNINFFSSFLSSKKENGADQLRRPAKNYGLNFSKIIEKSFLGNLNLNIIYNHYGKYFDTHSSNFNTIQMKSTDIIDLKISRELNNSSKFYIKVTNLLNESYQKPHGFNQENRILKFGIIY
jgi:vitamin B12 transporter